MSQSQQNSVLTSFGIAAVVVLAALVGVFAGSTEGVRAPARPMASVRNNVVDDATGDPVLGGFQMRAPRVPDGALRYDVEYPTIPYSRGERQDAIAKLVERLARREVRLEYREGRGYLDSLLAALEIDPASQVLVFSQTSLQSRLVSPRTPRAIYFNDEVYVAFVQGAPLEIASLDPNLGPVFYLLEQERQAPRFESQLQTCLACHDSYSLTGGGVPRFLVGSGYTGTTGMLVSHEGWILVSDRTPLTSRWGGWYVTGKHGDQRHIGNLVIHSMADFPRLEELRVGNLDTVDGLFDTKPYLTNKSDIVALLVFQHQADVQNLITRVSYDARTAIAERDSGRITADQAAARIAEPVERLLAMMLFVDAVEYTAPISGIPEFTEQFASRAVRDGEGRSLRDFDLTRRLFRYPLSYLVYSAAFDALPTEAKQLYYRRLGEVLSGADRSEAFAHLSAADRSAIATILRATKPDFVAAVTP
jgi:hypothetical protein